MNSRLRMTAGGIALAVGLFALTTVSNAAPELPADAYKATVTADVAFIQKKLEDIVAAPDKNRGAVRTVRAAAMMLVVYAEGTKNDALKGQALKVAAAMDKKDFAAAAAAAKDLSSPKADAAALKLTPKFDIEDVMSPFRVAKSGGMNIEKDIKDILKAGKVDAAAALVMGVRTAAISEYTLKMPTDKATTSPALTKKWERWTKDMADASKQLADEAVKGDKADHKALMAAMKKLDASCSNCHNDFRND